MKMEAYTAGGYLPGTALDLFDAVISGIKDFKFIRGFCSARLHPMEAT